MRPFDDNNEQKLLTYMEYRAHCHLKHKASLPRAETGPLVHIDDIKYGDKPAARYDFAGIFRWIANCDGVITRESLLAAMAKARIDARHLLGIFDLLGCNSIDEALFLEIFN